MKTQTVAHSNRKAEARNALTWERSTDDVIVGKDVLELVSSAMYVDPMTIYREYVQNAADAIDEARRSGLLGKPESGIVDICVDGHTRSLRIRDNGPGIPSAQFTRRMTALGASPKRGASARGFRGVGRLAGLAYCQELIFRSRAKGERFVSELRWDCRRLKALFRDAQSDADLRSVVRDVIAIRKVPAGEQAEHFFEVELRGVVRHRSDRLLNPQAIADYLSQVAPVPFSPDFAFGREIVAALHPHVSLGNLLIYVSGVDGPLYRPHRDTLNTGDGESATYGELEIKEIMGSDGNLAGSFWLLHHNYAGAIPNESMVKGLRFRVGNVQIGEHTLLEDLFPETRFNAWTVGEIHVLDKRVVPNGRRDHFEQTAHYNNLLNQLAPAAREVGRRCRTSSICRKWLRDFETHRTIALEKIGIISQGSLPEKSRIEFGRNAERAIVAMEKIAHMDRFDLGPDEQLQLKVRDVRAKLTRALHKKLSESPLADLPTAKRKMYEHLFTLIYECSANRVAAKSLVDRILEKVISN